MSFYGSVYYQLIDTFHKITGKNSGKNTVTLPSSTANSELEATGRKSVINLDTGNRWINISKDGEAFLLSHRGTDNDNIKSPVKAVEVVDGAGEGSGENKDSAKQLNYEDVLKVSTIYRDEAGHITTKKEPFYIKLPAEPPITDDIKSLQYYSGIRNKPADPDNPTEAELTNKTIATNAKLYEKTVSNSAMTDPKTNLYNYVIHNYEVAKIHKGPLHDWSGICDSYNNNANNQNNITIKKAIGDLDNLFQGGTYKKYLGSNGGSKVYTGGIVSCIGNMYALHEPFKKQESVAFTLVDALLDLNNQLAVSNTNISQNAAANETTSNLINEHIDASKTKFSSIDTSLTTINTTIGAPSGTPIYQEIANLHAKDGEILGILGTRLNANLTAFGEIAALQTKTDNTNKVVKDNKSVLDKKDGELQKEIDDLESLVGTRLNTSKTVFNEISDTNKVVEDNKIALDEEDDRLEALIGDLNTLIGTQKTEGVSVFTEISSLKSYFSGIQKTTVTEEITSKISEYDTGLKEYLSNYVSYSYLANDYKTLTDGYYIAASKLETLATKAELETLATKAELENYILTDSFSTLLDETIAESSKTGEDGQSTLNSLSEMSKKIVELEGKVETLEKQIQDLTLLEAGTE